MKTLLIVTAVIEVLAGAAFLLAPALSIALLLGSLIDTPAALTVGRLTGAALLSLGVACWLARLNGQNWAARGLVIAMVLYNIAAVVILGAAGVRSQPIGVALWPAVFLHAAMAAWCIMCLKMRLNGPP
jgi:hypothetical protein